MQSVPAGCTFPSCILNNKSNYSLMENFQVTMILYEVLRLYSPFPVIHRSTGKSVRLGHYTLPAGIEVVIPVCLIHRDPEIWGDDSEEFNPERFSAGIQSASKHQVGFIPFGLGPKICIGSAITTAKLAVAMILQHFSFKLSPSYVHAPWQPQHGAQLILSHYEIMVSIRHRRREVWAPWGQFLWSVPTKQEAPVDNINLFCILLFFYIL